MSGGVNKIGETDPRSVFRAGSDNQQQEVTVVTSAGISFSGAPDINSANENSSPMGEDQKICGKATHLAEKSMVTIWELAAFVG